MILKKIFEGPPKEAIHKDSREAEVLGSLDRLEVALFHISTLISAHKDLPKILAAVAQESLGFFKANRSTVFLVDGKTGLLRSQYSYAPNPADKQVNPAEETEIAMKTIMGRQPFLLNEPDHFSTSSKSGGKKRNVHSILSAPLFCRGNPMGVLSVVLIDDNRSFKEKELKWLSIFAKQASIAIENTHLMEELRKETHCRDLLEKHLDNILNQLQRNGEGEPVPTENEVPEFLADPRPSEKEPLEIQAGNKTPGIDERELPLGESMADPEGGVPAQESWQKDFEDPSLAAAKDPSCG